MRKEAEWFGAWSYRRLLGCGGARGGGVSRAIPFAVRFSGLPARKSLVRQTEEGGVSTAIAAKALFFTVNGRGMQRAASCGTAAFADRRRAFGSVLLLPSSEQIRDRPRAPPFAPACSRCPETNFPQEFLKRRRTLWYNTYPKREQHAMNGISELCKLLHIPLRLLITF